MNGMTRAAPQPAVSRPADAARTAPRRLHRQRQRRAHACRCAARRCSTRGARSPGCTRRATIASASSASSLGSCLSLLTTAHEPLMRAQALNHISPYFADVVWRGHFHRACPRGARRPYRARSAARSCGSRSARPISSSACADRQTLLVYARYDLTFPVDLSREPRAAVRERRTFRMKSRCFAAGITRPAQRRSSSSTAGSSRGSCAGPCCYAGRLRLQASGFRRLASGRVG